MNIDQENFNGIDGVDHFEALSKQNESQIFEIIFVKFTNKLFVV